MSRYVDPIGCEQLVDSAVRIELPELIACQALEAGLVADTALFELHQHGALSGIGYAGEIDDEKLWLVQLGDGFDRGTKPEEGAFEACQVRDRVRLTVEEHAGQLPQSRPGFRQLLKEGLELTPRVVEDDDAPLEKLLA